MLGTVILAVPVFGTPEAKVVSKSTPLAANRIFTVWQFIGAILDCPTVQFTVCVLFCAQVGGVETVKGGASTTVTTTLSEAVFPPTEELSLTVSKKFMVLATEGTTSQVEAREPERTRSEERRVGKECRSRR